MKFSLTNAKCFEIVSSSSNNILIYNEKIGSDKQLCPFTVVFFSIPVSTTNKTDHHNTIEILLKLAFLTHKTRTILLCV
jgi:hypothetical protein